MIKITLPSSEVSKILLEAKKDCNVVTGFFCKYNVKINRLTIEIDPKDVGEVDPTDIFHLAWYLKEYV